MHYLIGVDIGTQGTKAALFDQDFKLISTAFEPSKLISPAPGTVWQEADDLCSACANTIREVIETSKIDPGSVAGVGLDGQMAGIMGVDEDGQASTYYDSWLDTRSGAYVDQMRARAGKEILRISGGPLTLNHGSKILWWKHEHPDAYKRTAKFVLPHGYVVGRMAGLKGSEAFFDYTCLHFSAFGDNEKKAWSNELLAEFGVDPDKMARVVSPFEVVGRVTKEFAAISALAEGTPVVAGCGDTAASTFGSGMFERDLILDAAGTASVLCAVVDSYVPDGENETLTMMRSPIDGCWLPLAYINGGGMCLPWLRDKLCGGNATYDSLEAEARAVPAGSEGLLFAPHFSGRVLPSDPSLKGSFAGLDFNHGRGHMYRAIMEGVAYEYRYYLSVLRKNYPQSNLERMITIGGGAKSRLFNQIKADVLGLNVHTFKMGETALLASAVIAGVGVGCVKDYKQPIQSVMRLDAEFTPREENAAVYAKSARSYLDVIDGLSPIYKRGVYRA